MPYVIETYNTPDAIVANATNPVPGGPGFSVQDARRATELKVLGSSFTDPGPEWCEFQLYRNEQLIGSRRLAGY